MMYDDLQKAYGNTELPFIDLGGVIIDDNLVPHFHLPLILKQFNRHGLVAGATGTGKTKTLQVLCEQLSLAGVPSLIMDMKGDISGLAMPGDANPKILEKCNLLGFQFNPQSFPVELLSLSENIKGVPVRAKIEDFGAVLFSRMLNLNDTQSGVVTILLEYAKDKQFNLATLEDIKALFRFAQSDNGKSEIEKNYGRITSASIAALMRKMIELESQGADFFFGEPAFLVEDLMRLKDSKGVISILRVMDMQDKPQLFSTFMVKLLSDLYRQLPEIGDPEKPKLVLFIDEAHLIFKNASKPLLNLLDTIVKLIRSKGVGLIFCTQTPKDVPENILSQLGLKIQHALRAFTAADRQSIVLTAKNFPTSAYYNTEELLTSLGIGQALVTAINAQGRPSPLVACQVRAPESRMGNLKDIEELGILAQSGIYSKYKDRISSQNMSLLEQDTKSASSKKTDETSNLLETLRKSTLVRQITRDITRKLVNYGFSLLKKK